MSYRPISSKYFQNLFNGYINKVEKRLNALGMPREPKIVYEPIRYSLASGGKRFRAALLMLSCEASGGKIQNTLNAAAAIEVLHNFTLVHDDVMDNAKLRRGKETVHARWDANVAILSGDEMVAQAYKLILETRTTRMMRILKVYTDALVQVCEGQGFDKEFESRENVTIAEYHRMILKKTGVVIAAATEIGAIIGSGSHANAIAFRSYGRYLGRAFQIMDDYLDIMGTEKEFGKKIGGDIREGKKTFLLLKSLEKVQMADRKLLRSIVPGNNLKARDIHQIKKIFINTGAVNAAKNEISRYTKNAKNSLKPVKKNQAKDILVWLADQMRGRTT